MRVADGLLLACGGFLLSVLWMDLIFDTQVRGEPTESALASIAAYYRRATTTSRPMSRLIAVVMVILLGTLVFRVVSGHGPGWLDGASVGLAVVAIGLALVRTVRNAVRLGAGTDGPDVAAKLARSVLRDHVVCFACMSAFIALRLVGLALT
jgi:hypothetical protein